MDSSDTESYSDLSMSPPVLQRQHASYRPLEDEKECDEIDLTTSQIWIDELKKI
jgi:hypothetical protein